MNPGLADALTAAQGLRCAGRALGLAPGWARCIVDRLSITRVPHAPPWLLGATAHEGRILPVIDMACWIDPAASTPIGEATMALIGEADGSAAALVLEDMPVPLRGVPASPAAAPDGLPAMLAGCTAGRAVDAQGEDWLLLDGAALAQAWLRAMDRPQGI